MDNGGISSLIANLQQRVLLLVVMWCLQKDGNMSSTKRNSLRDSDSKNIPVNLSLIFEGRSGIKGTKKTVLFLRHTRGRHNITRGSCAWE